MDAHDHGVEILVTGRNFRNDNPPDSLQARINGDVLVDPVTYIDEF